MIPRRPLRARATRRSRQPGRRALRAGLAALAPAAALLSPVAADASVDPLHGYAVTIHVPPQSPLVGDPFVITGDVSPHARDHFVKLQRLYDGRFHTVAKTRLDNKNRYVFAQVYNTAGNRYYRVVKPRDKRHHEGISPVRRVFVTGNSLRAVSVLRAGDTLISHRGSYLLSMLPTGNLVLRLASDGRTLWSFGTGGHPGATALLRRDGNLVVRDHAGHLVKTTRSGGHKPRAYTMTIQENSNLVIRSPRGDTVWSSQTTNPMLQSREKLLSSQHLDSANRRFQLLMQSNGNLVLRNTTTDRHLWEVDTGVRNSHLVMGPAGALSIHAPTGKLLWSTHTVGYPGSVTVLQDDGNLVIYHDGSAIWSWEGIGGVLGDDYPEWLRDAQQDSIVDPWHFYNRECTSFVAWRLNSANGVDFDNFMGGGRFGNAGNWDDNARALGYRVDNVPARGAIAESDSEGSVGHVAWVAAVGDGVVTIEDYNYGGPGTYDVRTVPTSQYKYIHIKDL